MEQFCGRLVGRRKLQSNNRGARSKKGLMANRGPEGSRPGVNLQVATGVTPRLASVFVCFFIAQRSTVLRKPKYDLLHPYRLDYSKQENYQSTSESCTPIAGKPIARSASQADTLQLSSSNLLFPPQASFFPSLSSFLPLLIAFVGWSFAPVISRLVFHVELIIDQYKILGQPSTLLCFEMNLTSIKLRS